MNAVKTKQEVNYELLNEMGIIENMRNYMYVSYENGGMMTLHVDLLNRENDRIFCAIAHNGLQNGDVMADPDMEIVIDLEKKTALPLTYRNDYVGVYEQVYESDEKSIKNETLKNELSTFLEEWLFSMIQLKYKVAEKVR